MRARSALMLLVVATGIVSCSGDQNGGPPPRAAVELPQLEPADGQPLALLIRGRESGRQFTEASLDLGAVAMVLKAAAGYAGDGTTGATRAAPSAGATHPLTVYLVAGKVDGLQPGVYEYVPRDHALVLAVGRDVRDDLAGACLGQEPVSAAPGAIVVAADFERTTDWYGDRGRRYVYMEAGAVMQNVTLMASALGLTTVAVGAFDDRKVAEVLGLTAEPVLVMPLGHRP